MTYGYDRHDFGDLEPGQHYAQGLDPRGFGDLTLNPLDRVADQYVQLKLDSRETSEEHFRNVRSGFLQDMEPELLDPTAETATGSNSPQPGTEVKGVDQFQAATKRNRGGAGVIPRNTGIGGVDDDEAESGVRI